MSPGGIRSVFDTKSSIGEALRSWRNTPEPLHQGPSKHTMFIRSSDKFAALLDPYFRLEDLEASSASAFGLWPDFRLAYFNSAWVRFAEANNGQPGIGSDWGVGARYFDAIAPPLRPFYERFLSATPVPGATLHPNSHVYECSSRVLFRKFRMQVYALRDRAGYLVINSLVAETPHDPRARAPQQPDLEHYVNEHGIITQCSHCRLTKYVGAEARWDWVPEWIEHTPPNTSHGLCELCFNYYYAESAAPSHGG